MLSLEDILSEMEKNTKFTRKQLYERVKSKHEELSGLVSMEGAAHLVARDLGVSILIPDKRELKIKDLVNGMRNINIKGRIIQILDTREFERKDGKKGRVCNLIITDRTGEVRIPLWDKQVNMLDEGKLNEGNVIQIKNAFARDNVFGGIEIRLSRLSRIEKIEDDESFPRQIVGARFKRIPIKEAKEGNYEMKGNIVQVFNVNPVFQTCPECRAKVEKTKKGYKCPEHGKVKPENNMIISGIMDDGTASIRSVFFRDQAKIITGLEPETLLKISQDEAINLIKENTLGNEIVVRGRIQKNKIFDTLEMIANEVEELDIEKESKRLINEIKSLTQVVS
jgi:ssDNA-binding replication factor A large subunit